MRDPDQDNYQPPRLTLWLFLAGTLLFWTSLYVYVPKLSAEQTQSVFNMIKQEISQLGGQSTVKRIWQSSWDIGDAVLPA